MLGSAAALSAVDHVLLRTRPQREDAVAKVRKTIGDPTEGAPLEERVRRFYVDVLPYLKQLQVIDEKGS